MSERATEASAGLRSLLLSVASTLGTRAIDIPSRYGFHLLVAAKLGVIEAGAFYIVFGALTLFAGVGRLGVDRALTREVAQAMAREDPACARKVIWRGLGLVAAFSTFAACFGALAAPFLAREVFGDTSLVVPLRLSAGILVPLCLSAGLAGALAGLHRVSTSQMVYSWAWPALFVGIAIWGELTLVSAFEIMFVAVALTFALAAILLAVWWPRGGARAQRPSNLRELAALGLALFSTEVVQLLVAALPALVLGVLATNREVGLYAMAWRLALVLNLLIVAMAAVASPRFAAAAAREDKPGLERTVTHMLGLTLLLGAVPFAVLTIAAPVLLSLFGEGFESGAAALRVLLVGQMILMLAACTPEMLGMTGHEKPMQRVNQIAILLYIPLLIALSYKYGDVGAAAAALAIAVVTTVGSSALSHQHFGFVPLFRLAGSVRIGG